MKALIFLFTMTVFTSAIAQSSASDTKAINTVINKFALYAEQQNAEEMGKLLDTNFRVILNQLFGSQEVIVLSRETYLRKIDNKEFGGEKKEVQTSDLIILGNCASVKVNLSGQKTSFTSLMHLVKDASGTWKIIDDVPVMS